MTLANWDTGIWFLADLSVRAALLATAAALCARLLRLRAPDAGHRFWALVTLGMLLLPLASFLPAFELDFELGAAPAGMSPVPVEVSSPQRERAAAVAAVTPSSSEPLGGAAPGSPSQAGAWIRPDWSFWLLAIYLSGVAALLLRLLAGLAIRHYRVCGCRRLTDPDLRRLAERLAGRAGIAAPGLLASSQTRIPFAMGLVRQRVVLPADWEGWTTGRLQAVLAHEMAHLRRRDGWAHWAGLFNRILYWFHPAAHWISRRLTLLAEQSCDRLALEWTAQSPRDYARHLLEVAAASRNENRPAWTGGTPMARNSQVKDRIEALLQGAASAWPVRRRWPALLAAALLLATSAFQIRPRAAAQESRAERVPAPTPSPSPGPTPQPTPRISLSGESLAVVPRPKPKPKPKPRVVHEGTRERTATPAEIQQWIAALSSGNPLHRADAAYQLRRVQPAPEAVPALTAVLGDRVPMPRPAHWEDGWNPEGTTDAGTQAALTLGSYGELAVGELVPLASAASPEVRYDAVLALAVTESERAFEPLVQALSDSSAPVRKQAAWGLGILHDRRGLDPLLAATRDPEWSVREMAVWGIALFEDAGALEAMAARLGDEHPQVREKAAWGLGLLEDPAAVSALAHTVQSDADPQVREKAAWALGLIESPSGVESLSIALSDSDPQVREKAAWGLGLIESRAAVTALAETLRLDSDPQVREQAAWALGLIESREAISPLIEALDDPESQVREKAAWALGLIGEASSVDALLGSLSDSDPAVQETAAWALGLIGDRRALDRLSAIEADPGQADSLREKARWAMGLIR